MLYLQELCREFSFFDVIIQRSICQHLPSASTQTGFDSHSVDLSGLFIPNFHSLRRGQHLNLPVYRNSDFPVCLFVCLLVLIIVRRGWIDDVEMRGLNNEEFTLKCTCQDIHCLNARNMDLQNNFQMLIALHYLALTHVFLQEKYGHYLKDIEFLYQHQKQCGPLHHGRGILFIFRG